MDWREQVNDIRYRASAPFLRGRGIEIGAGAFPQRIPETVEREFFDIRGRDELREQFASDDVPAQVYRMEEFSARFPSGADFIIAHQVLEHAPDPIGQLIAWHGMLKSDGVMVISLPYAGTCGDRARAMAPIEHLLLDYLLNRDHLAFESREHVYSFVMGWNEEGVFQGRSKKEVAELAHWSANREFNDLHWHTFDERLSEEVIRCAAIFADKRVHLMLLSHPQSAGELPTMGDVILIYRLAARTKVEEPADTAIIQKLDAIRITFSRASMKVDRATHRPLRKIFASGLRRLARDGWARLTTRWA